MDGVVFPGAHGTTITRIRWDWGDGDSEDHWFAASHTYDQPGEYEITVTAYQSDGSYSTETKQISLGAPPNGWRRFVLPGATVLAAIMLLGIVWGNTTLRMRRKMRRWEQEGYDLSDWR